jgi:hypothetical protein
MSPKDIKMTALRMGLTLLSIGALLVFFVLLLELLAQSIRIYGGMRGVIALFSMVGMGIVTLVFVIVVAHWYTVGQKKGTLIDRFFAVTAGEGFLFVFLELLRFFIYLPVYTTNDISPFVATEWHSYTTAGVGLAVGVAFTVLAKMSSSS